MTSEHPYHRSIAPMMWVFVGLAGVELLVVHLLLALWDWRVALGVSLVSLAGIIWLVRALASFRRLPVLVGSESVTLRVGRVASIEVPRAEIAAVRMQWSGDELKRQGTRNLALIAYPNVLVELSAPVRVGRRHVRAVAHRLDDPSAFVTALGRVDAAEVPSKPR